MYKTRLLSQRLRRVAEHFPAVLIAGARQVGKSTLVRHVFPQADYVLLDSVLDAESARREPELFLANHPGQVIIDEIQYAPELVSVIKRLVDVDRKPGRFILTGSQQWAVMRSLSESLAGRVVILDLEGFSLQEMAQEPGGSWLAAWMADNPHFGEPRRLGLEHTLYETIWRGALPEATQIPLDLVQNFHDSYLRTYLERDARMFADISDWSLFGRFVRLISALTAQEINFSQVGRELGLTPQTSRRWLDILKATFQWFEVPAFHRNVVKRVSSKPKGYIADTGLACNSQAISSPSSIASHPMWGALFETAVVAEIRKQCLLLSPSPHVYHWRNYSGAEVDCILERDGVFYPIEVRATARPAGRDTSGITAFRKTYPDLNIARGLVVAPTERFAQISEHDWAMPWDAVMTKSE